MLEAFSQIMYFSNLNIEESQKKMTIDLNQIIGIHGKNIHRKFMSNNRILVLGANGMLGKMVSLYLSSNKEFNVFVTARYKVLLLKKILKKNI